jgi:hypothetical protein
MTIMRSVSRSFSRTWCRGRRRRADLLVELAEQVVDRVLGADVGEHVGGRLGGGLGDQLLEAGEVGLEAAQGARAASPPMRSGLARALSRTARACWTWSLAGVEGLGEVGLLGGAEQALGLAHALARELDAGGDRGTTGGRRR